MWVHFGYMRVCNMLIYVFQLVAFLIAGEQVASLRFAYKQLIYE